MAKCPCCPHEISALDIMMKPMRCPACGTKFKLDKLEHRRAARPGLVTAILVLFNIQLTADLTMRLVINGVLLLAWILFFRKYIRFLDTAQLEVRE